MALFKLFGLALTGIPVLLVLMVVTYEPPVLVYVCGPDGCGCVTMQRPSLAKFLLGEQSEWIESLQNAFRQADSEIRSAWERGTFISEIFLPPAGSEER